MKKKLPKKKADNRMTKVIKLSGYEYTLVEGPEERGKHDSPCFMRNSNWALKSCRKIGDAGIILKQMIEKVKKK